MKDDWDWPRWLRYVAGVGALGCGMVMASGDLAVQIGGAALLAISYLAYTIRYVLWVRRLDDASRSGRKRLP